MADAPERSVPQTDEAVMRDRAVRLFTFLREVALLRTVTVRHLRQYDDLIWLADIPQEDECYCAAWHQGEEAAAGGTWIEVGKPRLLPAPEVPETLVPWLSVREVSDSTGDFPELRERITIRPEGHGDDGKVQVQEVELSDRPEIKQAWEKWVESRWWPWAEEDRRLRRVQEVYNDLFSVYQRQQRLGEAYEVVFGLGCLAWKTPTGQEVRRHLVVAQTTLTFDAERGVISVGPAGEGARPTLEQEMLETDERPSPQAQNVVEQQLQDTGDAIWDGTQVAAALKSWVHSLSSEGSFDESLAQPESIPSRPTVHLAPALVLRRRTERGLLRLLKEIIEQLQDGVTLPEGVARLVRGPDRGVGEGGSEGPPSEDGSGHTTPPPEIYFPLVANDEQIEIVRRLSSQHGVLVQGPPGTGKSHTIANLVSHLLATGHRVLVTSHAPRALRVLRDKIPPAIADLCVMLLGDDRHAMQDLEDSVRAITDRHNKWDERRHRQRVADLEEQLDQARRREAGTAARLRSIREAETYEPPPMSGGYSGTAQQIAQRLCAEEPRFSWLPAPTDGHAEPSLTDAEALELLRLGRECSQADESGLRQGMPSPEHLPAPDVFVDRVEAEASARARLEAAAADVRHPGYPALLKASVEQRDALVPRLAAYRAAWGALAAHPQGWVKSVVQDVVTGQHRSWVELRQSTKRLLLDLGDRCPSADQMRLDGLDGRDRATLKADAESLLHHLESGGRLGWGPLRPGVVRPRAYLLREVRVDGQLCSTPDALRGLVEWIAVQDLLADLRLHWAPHCTLPEGPCAPQAARFADLYEQLDRAVALLDTLSATRAAAAAIPGLREPAWHEPESIAALERAVDAVSLEEQLTKASETFGEALRALRACVVSGACHPEVSELEGAIRQRAVGAYREAYQRLLTLWEWKAKLQRRDELLQRLQDASPDVADQLTSSFSNTAWDQRLAEFTAAWNWRQADTWLQKLNDQKEYERLADDAERWRQEIRDLLGQLAAEKAWGHRFSGPKRMTEHELSHLVGWTKAIGAAGKRKGKRVAHYDKVARDDMDECRSAIPAWVMPLYRVAETIHPSADAFDVVIVDEASQSGLEALFLSYLAKRVIVVGDDQQIKPDNVGQSPSAVDDLRLRYIHDLPLSAHFGIEYSFFDQAEIRYRGRIRLTEHFRCMPEIIQFSNNLCYSNQPLIPLRQYGTARLQPVVVTRHVPDGYQQGHSPRIANQPEAEALVDQIVACCGDAQYEGKSMGVISLLGEDQARLIEQTLLQKLGAEEMERRRLVCGDAYAFQGDERDVMFLSMVSAPSQGYRIGVLSGEAAKRRFNVAASRARDQMWLFHTATLNDLSQKCYRYALLQYCQDPKPETIDVGGLPVAEWRRLAARRGRDEKPPRPFDSWFEVDVFLKIVDRGYRVIPQFEVAGKRIDLVVEGMRGRLAVECDGDDSHGLEQYEADQARQRMLERCDCTFWRVRGSTFYRDPEAALRSLWETLDDLGIHPSSAETPEDAGADDEAPHAAEPEGGDLVVPAGTPADVALTERPDVPRDPDADAETRSHPAEQATQPTEGPRDADEPSQLALPLAPTLFDREAAGDGAMQRPYRHWAPRPLPDPRTANAKDILPGLVEIIEAEGPMLCHRAYQLYAKAAGIGKVGRQVRSALNRALSAAVHAHLVEQVNEHATEGQVNTIVRKAGTPPIVARARGDRRFEEIPPSEVAAVMRAELQSDPSMGTEELFRAVQQRYDIGRLTSNMRESLQTYKERFVDTERRLKPGTRLVARPAKRLGDEDA